MNILIVGLGSIAAKHITALKLIDEEFNIYALRSKPDSPIVEGVINVYDLIGLDIIFDFAVISNPTYLHYHYIELLTAKGIDLFIEKPPVSSLDAIDGLLEKIGVSKNLTYVACNLRFHPCLQFLKKQLEEKPGQINEVNVYCGSYLPDWRPGKNFKEIYSANPEMGGGVHLDLFHELDYTTWLFGLPNKSQSVFKNISSLEIEAVDYANYILEYNDFTASIILNYYRRKPKREIEVVFDNDTWTIDLIKNEIRNDAGDYLFKASSFNVKETYVLQLEYFINCLRKNQTPMNSFKESIQNLKICLNDE